MISHSEKISRECKLSLFLKRLKALLSEAVSLFQIVRSFVEEFIRPHS